MSGSPDAWSFCRIIFMRMKITRWWEPRGTATRAGTSLEQLEKLLTREEQRLRISFEAAKAAGYRKYIMFLHYPPTSIYEEGKAVLPEWRRNTGRKRWFTPIAMGEDGMETVSGKLAWDRVRLVSSDYLRFVPDRIL